MSTRTFTVFHCGDYGDILHSCPILKAISAAVGHPVKIVVSDKTAICKRIVHRLPVIEPLLLSQPYIKEIKELADEEVNWLAGDFRTNHDITSSLASAHLRHYRGQKQLPAILPNFKAPWLTGIKPITAAASRIIINRTNRYGNKHFRWREIVTHYWDALLFVGTREEHAAFCMEFGTVAYMPTADLLEVAELIAACQLFIGNQSACFAIAEGMKRRRLLEVCPWQPDVIIEAPSASVFYSADGSLDLPPIAGRPALKCGPAATNVNYLKNPNTQPRTGWKVGDTKELTYDLLKRTLMRRDKLSDQDAHKLIFDALADREPDWFGVMQPGAEQGRFKQALANVR